MLIVYFYFLNYDTKYFFVQLINYCLSHTTMTANMFFNLFLLEDNCFIVLLVSAIQQSESKKNIYIYIYI